MPSIQLNSGVVDMLTVEKAKQITERFNCVINGCVISCNNGSVAIVQEGRVCWLTKEEWLNLIL